jgi:hypothetical protein
MDIFEATVYGIRWHSQVFRGSVAIESIKIEFSTVHSRRGESNSEIFLV